MKLAELIEANADEIAAVEVRIGQSASCHYPRTEHGIDILLRLLLAVA